MGVDYLIDRLRGDPLYIKYLLVEYPYVRAALEAHGAAASDEDKVEAYSSSIGNALHNDIIELDQWLSTLDPNDVKALFKWANGRVVVTLPDGTVVERESPRRPSFSVRRLTREFRDRNA